jgi:hypothetical protein
VGNGVAEETGGIRGEVNMNERRRTKLRGKKSREEKGIPFVCQ